MKLSVQEIPELDDIEVSILCPKVDARVSRIIEMVEQGNAQVVGLSEGFLCKVRLDDILYIESVDGKTFAYTTDKVVEINRSLAEAEEGLVGTEFVRASRQLLVNLAHVQGIRPYLNARLEIALDNGERVIASRQFAPAIKKRIGL